MHEQPPRPQSNPSLGAARSGRGQLELPTQRTDFLISAGQTLAAGRVRAFCCKHFCYGLFGANFLHSSP